MADYMFNLETLELKPIKKTTWIYRGVVIFRNTQPGARLRYSARLNNGTPLAADTLEGIKQLIRQRS